MIERLRDELIALASELAILRERIGRSSRDSSKPPTSDGKGFIPPERRARAMAASSVVNRVILDPGRSCRRCGKLLKGEYP